MPSSNRIQTFRLSSLTGGMNTTAEENSLITFDNGIIGQGSEARLIENFTPLNRGGQSKTKGFSIYKALGSAVVTGIYRYEKSNNTAWFLAGAGNSLYQIDVPGSPVLLYSGLGTNAYLDFETALDQCVICDGINAPIKFDGTTLSALGGGAPNGTQQSLFYQNRLWLFGGSNPSLLYYSDPGNISAGYSSNYVNCDVNDGQRITSITAFFIPGQLRPVILVGKNKSVGMVTGEGTTSDPYTFIKINQDAGIPGFRQMVQFGQDVAYLTTKGLSSFQTNNAYVNLTYTQLSEKIRDLFLTANPNSLYSAITFYDWKHSRITVALAEANQTYPNVLYHFDTRMQSWYRERWAENQTCTAIWIDPDGTCFHGDHLGNVYKHGDTNSFDGKAISATYKTPYLDFGTPHLYKRIIAARAILRGSGNYALGIETALDYGARIGKSYTIPLGGDTFTWGTGYWSASGLSRWGASPIRNRKFHPSGFFQNIQFTFNQTGIEQPMDLFQLEFDVELSSLL
jgi:hypothetical protein